MLSFVELKRAAAQLEQELREARLQAVSQSEARPALGLTFYAEQRVHVLLSCDPETARVSRLERALRSAPTPPALAQFVRAHCVGAHVTAVRMAAAERELAIALHAAEGDFELLLALFGRRSNLYVLDAERRIRASLRPLAETRAELALGEPWRSPQAAAPRQGEDRFAEVADAELLDAIESTYAELESEGSRNALARRIGQALRREIKTVERKLERLDQELVEAEADTALERQGELLKPSLSGLKRGDRDARVRDHATGEELTIPLDPTLTPSENLERMFKRYRKAVRALAKGGAQRDAVRASRDALAALEGELETAGEDVAALEALAARPELAALLARHAPAPAVQKVRDSGEREIAGRKLPLRLVPRRYRTESGLEIWVGRSDEANDLLSTRLARGNDLFFHLDGAPGSHVILRTEGRPDPPSEAVLEACELAVHFSKQKNATRADVHVVPAKNVRKPKGAKPGLVTVHGGRSVHLRREPKRLERILASKIED